MPAIHASLSDRACALRALGLVILSDKTCLGQVEDVSGGERFITVRRGTDRLRDPDARISLKAPNGE